MTSLRAMENMLSRAARVARRTLTTRAGLDRPYEVVMPGKVSMQVRAGQLDVPAPAYAASGVPERCAWSVPEIKTPDQIQGMRESCRLAADILNRVEALLQPGVTTDAVDRFVMDAALRHNAYPSPLNYRGFPKSVCTSVNNCVCHGIPDDRPLRQGDIINVDVTVYLNGFHGDCSRTFQVGQVDDAGRKLLQVAEECLEVGVQACGPGTPFPAIGERIWKHAVANGFKVVPCFIGHGIGSYFHGPPDIHHTPNRYPGRMMPGMTFTIEPALSEGTDRVVILDDHWTAVTADNSRAAQFEHTVLVTEDGVDILTAV